LMKSELKAVQSCLLRNHLFLCEVMWRHRRHVGLHHSTWPPRLCHFYSHRNDCKQPISVCFGIYGQSQIFVTWSPYLVRFFLFATNLSRKKKKFQPNFSLSDWLKAIANKCTDTELKLLWQLVLLYIYCILGLRSFLWE
jgi:hypothetical protein